MQAFSDKTSQERTQQIIKSNEFKGIKVIAFDLDDTLHKFAVSSKAAIYAVCNHIAKSSKCEAKTIRAEYSNICKTHVTPFTDGRTSYDYRFERMKALSDNLGLGHNKEQTNELVGIYTQTINEYLTLEPSALDVMKHLKQTGHKVGIVTEGPQDAQEEALKVMGIDKYTDFLITSNKAGVSKNDGLYGKVLEVTGVEANEVLVVGDSLEKDVLAPRKLGMHALHYNTKTEITRTDEINHHSQLLAMFPAKSLKRNIP